MSPLPMTVATGPRDIIGYGVGTGSVVSHERHKSFPCHLKPAAALQTTKIAIDLIGSKPRAARGGLLTKMHAPP